MYISAEKAGAKYRFSNIHPCLNSFWLNNIEIFKIYITNMCNCRLCVKLKRLSPLSTQRKSVDYEGWTGRYQISRENTKLYFLTLYIIALPFFKSYIVLI